MPFLNSIIPAFSRAPSTEKSSDNAVAPGIRPVYNVDENDDGYTVTAYLPGVSKNDLNITDEDGVLTIRGERSWKQPTGWTSLYRESSSAAFELSFQHDNVIDPDKVQAELANGVLRLTLPKTEARKPRKITVS